MIQLYSHAPDSIVTGTQAYAESLLRLQYQYFYSGLIEVRLGIDNQIVILISDGTLIGSYCFKDASMTEFSIALLPSYWPSGKAQIRSVSLPREAVRSGREMIEWSPPSQILTINSEDLLDYLNQYKQYKTNGLIQLLWEQSEGFLLMEGGNPTDYDSVLSTPNGVEAGNISLEAFLKQISTTLTIRFYETRPGTTTFQQNELRYSFFKWNNNIFSILTQSVENPVISSLINDLNVIMRSKGWHVQYVNGGLRDTHVFPSLDSMIVAYCLWITTLSDHVASNKEQSFPSTVIKQAFDFLSSKDQQVLNRIGSRSNSSITRFTTRTR